MNTHDIDIELPPLPEPAHSRLVDGIPTITMAEHMDIAVQHARAAIEAALQSQDREDAQRIQFMADEACTFNTWKQEDGSWKYRLEWDHGTEWQTQWFDSPEEAIDHARRVEGADDA